MVTTPRATLVNVFTPAHLCLVWPKLWYFSQGLHKIIPQLRLQGNGYRVSNYCNSLTKDFCRAPGEGEEGS